jgi:hypothetical protein
VSIRERELGVADTRQAALARELAAGPGDHRSALEGVLSGTASCPERADEEPRRDIERIRASNDPAERQSRQIARREQQMASGKRMLATCRFNGAVAAYRLGRTDEARRLAEQVVDDEQFGSRARELLARLR